MSYSISYKLQLSLNLPSKQFQNRCDSDDCWEIAKICENMILVPHFKHLKVTDGIWTSNMSFKLQFIGLRFVGGQKCEERGGVCKEVEDDEAPGTQNNASNNDENNQGAKINHVCSSVKHDRSMVDQNFRTQS